MTLIGLAYNQKPEPTELTSPASEGGRQEDGELPRPDEEPPSRISNLSIAELIARDELADLYRVAEKLTLPLFVKPVHEGSSKGITDSNLCRDHDQLFRQTEFLLENYRQPVLVEEFLPGKEFTCAVLGNGAEATVLPLVAMNFESLPEGALPIYSFDAKFVWDRPENPLDIFQCPARITRELQASIERVTLDAFRVLGCRDWARIDVRLDASGKPNVLEVNPLPGILPDPADNSCLPKAARAAGIGYEER